MTQPNEKITTLIPRRIYEGGKNQAKKGWWNNRNKRAKEKTGISPSKFKSSMKSLCVKRGPKNKIG